MPMNGATENPKKDRLLVYKIAAILVGFGLTGNLIRSALGTDAAKFFGAGMLLAFAAFCSGGLFGLLFGIPRVAQIQSDEVADAERKPASLGKFLAANNNLIQISDWLTKILVGATLTQLNRLPAALSTFGRHYGADLGGESVAVFILIGFSASGFLTGYLFTRVVLQHALHRADKVPLDDAKDKSDIGPDAPPIQDPNPNPSVKKTAHQLGNPPAMNTEKASANAQGQKDQP